MTLVLLDFKVGKSSAVSIAVILDCLQKLNRIGPMALGAALTGFEFVNECW